ncbi:hypothetical protein Taro_052882 [Colocasia esculenta]|uniref:Jasmonate O-methyltransferase n=1 Tax=Colocasia esculenta TaxID=4460 RepID=A0A843XJT3_COLES|nr:hypothetical protein [Colocasia esculenta]
MFSVAPSPLQRPQEREREREIESWCRTAGDACRLAMEVKVLHMNGGEGETSYAKNSSIQKRILQMARSAVEEAVLELCSAVSFPAKLSVADLGCSSGPNVLSVVSGVVDTVEERCRQLGLRPPEFQLFLNDLPGNDFNSVFRSLQALHERRVASAGLGKELGQCFVAGVPGSFHGRLFQSRSIHFIHSASSLHWLSQVPLQLQLHQGLVNKGNICISKQSPPPVVNAYSMQFQNDFSDFLKFRSEEMVIGGHMVLILVGRKTVDPTSEMATFQWNLLTQVLMGMVHEGHIAEEKVDSFNAPYYSPCALEVENEMRKEGSFSLKRLIMFEMDWDAEQVLANHIDQNDFIPQKTTRGQSMANCVRAVLEPMLTTHFGGDMIEDIFVRYSEILKDYLERKRPKLTNIVVSLVRKS